jgi:hypothetical protein
MNNSSWYHKPIDWAEAAWQFVINGFAPRIDVDNPPGPYIPRPAPPEPIPYEPPIVGDPLSGRPVDKHDGEA